MLTLELAVAGRYGFHRDELYFIQCGRHLAWGYVDQPPLVPALARAVTSVFGVSVFWLRLPSAIAGSACVVMSALIARRLGGGRSAQILAAVASATSAQAVAAFHLLSTTAFDIFFWTAITYLVVRLLRSENPQWWLPIGLVTGIALQDKLNVLFLVAGLLIGFVATGRWRLLSSRWLVGGAATALVLASPDIVWNATHHWAQLAMLHSLHSENSTLGASVAFVPSQLLVVGPVLAWLWVPGAWRLVRQPVMRPLGAAFVALLVAYALSGAKSYYLAGIYDVLFAAGAVRMEEYLTLASPRQRSAGLRRRLAVLVAGLVAGVWLMLPVLPEPWLARGSWQGSIDKDLSATVGWPALARQVAAIADHLPPAARARLVVFTGDYGAAGAIDLFGPRYGLPTAISGHNSFWWWGPGGAPDGSTTIAVNLSRSYLRTIFADVRPAGAVRTPNGVWSEERGEPIWVCTHQRVSWDRAWPAARHYD